MITNQSNPPPPPLPLTPPPRTPSSNKTCRGLNPRAFNGTVILLSFWPFTPSTPYHTLIHVVDGVSASSLASVVLLPLSSHSVPCHPSTHHTKPQGTQHIGGWIMGQGFWKGGVDQSKDRVQAVPQASASGCGWRVQGDKTHRHMCRVQGMGRNCPQAHRRFDLESRGDVA